jgi:hypothetical protein
VKDKHSSFLGKFVIYGRKKFHNIGPRRKRDDADDFLCGFGTTINDAAIGATIGNEEIFRLGDPFK